jgi:nucleoside-diphosphate-sugar epimerase
MKILLTGASGFIGGHLLHALIKKFGNNAIIALTSNEIPDVECLIYESTSDFGLDKDCFDNITHVIHAGAFIPKDSKQANNIFSCSESIEYTKHLFSYDFKELIRFINVSTVDIYASSNEPISENSNIDSISLYGSSKLYCEKMAKAFSVQRENSYMNLRIGHVYGPGEEKYKKVVPIAIENILKDKPLELWGKGDDLRSFIYIEDVVDSIINSLESTVQNLDINIVSGKAISIHDLLYTIIDISGEMVEVKRIESNHEKRDLVFDNSLLLKTLLNKETDLIDGLTKEYDYMKAKYETDI